MKMTPEIRDMFRRVIAESLEEAIKRRTLHAADLSHIARMKIRRMR